MMKHLRDAEKAMRNLQLQVAGMSQPNPQAQPIRQLPPQHGSQFIEHSTQITHHPPVYHNPQPPYRFDPGIQAHGPPPKGERYSDLCVGLRKAA